jgi:glycosyltransferase involved in cell wall biosynthesis
MTIAFLTNHFPPRVDGVGDYTAYLAAALVQRGLVVHVICRKQEAIVQPKGVTVHAVAADWSEKSKATVLDTIREIQPDWVAVQYVPYSFQHLGLPFFLPDFLRQIRRNGTRVCVMFHEVHIRPQGVKGWIIGQLQRRIARRMCRYADVVVTSIAFYRQLLAPFHTDVRVIPVGANIEVQPLAEAERQRLRQQIFPDQSCIVSTFGRRDISGLVAAAGLMDGVGVLAIGAGGQTFQVSKTWKVYCTGHLPPVEVGAWLQSSDVFVLPDVVSPHGEGGTCLKSGSLAAAFAAGLPVIGVRGDMTGLPLRHGENIWLVERGDAESLFKAIRMVQSDPVLRERLRANGAILYREHLAWEVLAEAYGKLFFEHEITA